MTQSGGPDWQANIESKPVMKNYEKSYAQTNHIEQLKKIFPFLEHKEVSGQSTLTKLAVFALKYEKINKLSQTWCMPQKNL